LKKSKIKIVKQATIIDNYRYTLSRIWNQLDDMVTFIMLNPSTADAFYDDPTVRRCIGFAQNWGYGGLHIVNLFAWRTPFPDDLSCHLVLDPVGPRNNYYIKKTVFKSHLVIAAWGSRHTFYPNRANKVISMINKQGKIVCYLKKNKDGSPGHPLYLKKDLQPIAY